MIRRGFVLLKPYDQIRYILPTFVTLVCSIVVNCCLIYVVRNFAADYLMHVGGKGPWGPERFIADSNVFFWLFWCYSAAFVFLGTIWAWWLSVRYFGPLARLEGNLRAILKGDVSTLQLTARKSDPIAPLFDLLGQYTNKIQSSQSEKNA